MKILKIDNLNSKTLWKVSFMSCLFAVMCVLPEIAAAGSPPATTTAIDNTMCEVVNLLTGRAGKAIATIGVVFLGIGLFMGKMSWSVALAVALGIGAIFGAGTIVNALGDTTTAGC
jgi:type IV secretion system protein VirB2